MNFGFTEEQELLRAEVRKFLDQNASLDRVREIVEAARQGPRTEPALWARMAELGWVGSEHAGGARRRWASTWRPSLVVLEETGRSLFPFAADLDGDRGARRSSGSGSPNSRRAGFRGWPTGRRSGPSRFSSAATLGARWRRDAREARWRRADPLGREALRDGCGGGGSLRRCGSERFGCAGDLARRRREGDGGRRRRDFDGMDLTKRIGRLSLEDARVGADCVLGATGADGLATQWLLDLGAALVTAEAVGAAEAALEITTEFAKERIQFGEQIGKFQGVKHPLAEIYVDVESFRSLVYYAAWAIDQEPRTRARGVAGEGVLRATPSRSRHRWAFSSTAASDTPGNTTSSST